ncbi:MAG: hypothetical protein BYD32DRAFT_487596 [Podila humilis]|nr:MAG: hypothetical protein BYD32DRAFT_487596 [Podila humilis]
MKQYFEDTFGCCGAMWQFVPDEGKDEASSKEDEERDNERGQWTGNPVFDKDFVRLMHQLKEADETRHVKRKPAFGYDEMAVFMERLQNSETIETEGIGRCLFIQAFAATAFTLWLTFDEVLQLKRGHIRLFRVDFEDSPHLEITLPFRRSDPIDPTQANIYNIYQRDDGQHVCCASALIQWIQWIELTNGHRLQADDFLFSELFDQLIQPNQPFPDPWPLKAIKWWGGWPKEESAEKISEYLLDDCQQETGFKDMMSPQRSKTRGRTGTTRHPEEALVLKARFGSAIRSMESRHATALGKMEKEVQDLNQENMALRQELATLSDVILRLDKTVHLLESRLSSEDRLFSPQLHPRRSSTPEPSYQQKSFEDWSDEPEPEREPEQPRESQSRPQPQSRPRSRSKPQPQSKPQLPPQRQPQRQSLRQQQRHILRQQLQEIEGQQLQEIERQQEEEERQQAQRRLQQRHSWSLPRLRIKQEEMSRRNYDDIQEHPIPRIKHWKEAVRQWEEGDPKNGLTLPLRDWDRESLRKNDTYRNHKLIVQEFDFYGRDENKMREVYGDVLNEGSDKLRKAIQARHKFERRGFEDDQDDWQDQLHPQPILRVWGWREAIRQWDEGDPENGLTVALCDWSREMRRSNHAYRDRQLLVREFEYYGRDEKRMQEAYGDVLNEGTDKLKKAIQARHKLEKRGAYEDVDEEEEPQQPQAQPIPKIKHWREAIR